MVKRKMVKQFVAIMLTFLILLFAAVTVSAAETADYKVNGLTVKEGDVVTYILYLKDIKETVAGINVSVKYDQDHLSVEKDTVNLPVFKDAVCNYAIKNEIIFNAANAGTGYEVPKDAMVFSVSFKVKGAEPSAVKITAEVLELYNMDLQKLTQDGGYSLKDAMIEGTLPDVVSPQDVDSRIEQAKKDAAQNPTDEGGSVNIWILIAGGAVVLCIAAVGIILMMKKNHAAVAEEQESVPQPEQEIPVQAKEDKADDDSPDAQ